MRLVEAALLRTRAPLIGFAASQSRVPPWAIYTPQLVQNAEVSSLMERTQVEAVSGKKAWRAVYVGLAFAVILFLIGFVPLFGLVAFAVWPTLVIVILCLVIGAIAATTRRITTRGYLLALASTLIALTALGAGMRALSAAAGNAGVHVGSRIDRQVQARIKEPVLLKSIATIAYDTALFETAGPWCRDPCIIVERIDQQRRARWEEPEELLARIGVQPVAEGDTRVTVTVQTREAGNRTLIDIHVQEAGETTATLNAVVPSARHEAELLLPRWAHYVLENNPLLQVVMPRREYLDANFIEKFLESSISVPAQEPQERNARTIFSRVVSRTDFDPPQRHDRSSPEFVKTNHLHKDPRCEGVIKFEANGPWADYFVTFHQSALPAPQARFADGTTPICAGDSVYRRVIKGGGVGSWLRFERYRLNGEYVETIHIQIPTENAAAPKYVDHPFFEPGSLIEEDRRLRFRLRKVHFEWAKDAVGKPVDRPDGSPLEYGFIEQVAEYEVELDPRNE